MRTLLVGGGVAVDDALVDFLFDDQRERNLWRAPVPGMIDVARRLRARGVPVAILSNSEGRLAALVAELGWTDDFPVVADSGVLGMEKPDPAIFAWTAARLAVPPSTLVHVGDSWAADVEGALGVGARAVWFPAEGDRARGKDRVAAARRVEDVEAALLAALSGAEAFRAIRGV